MIYNDGYELYENGKLIRKDFHGKSKREDEELRDEYVNGIKSELNIDFINIFLGKLMHF